MKWKRKGGKSRAYAAGCQFVITRQSLIIWTSQYCDRYGNWSETMEWNSKDAAIGWCEAHYVIENQKATVDEKALAARRLNVSVLEAVLTKTSSWVIKVYRLWRHSTKAQRATIEKQHGMVSDIAMRDLERLEATRGVKL